MGIARKRMARVTECMGVLLAEGGAVNNGDWSDGIVTVATGISEPGRAIGAFLLDFRSRI